VSITTTGYGDVRPVSDEARLLTTVLVTPARVLFLILLVGTTLEILAQRSRDAYRRSRWRRTLNDHIIICGFGVKGRSALRTLLAKNVARERIVVIDEAREAREQATAAGLTAVCGSAASTEVLLQGGVRDARSIIVAVNRDDTAVLVTLTARELNPDATIVASVRVGQGLDIAEHTVADEDAGAVAALAVGGPVVAVVRGDDLMRFDDPRAATVKPGDRVVFLRSHRH
jgi:voltage-gated potassium channel